MPAEAPLAIARARLPAGVARAGVFAPLMALLIGLAWLTLWWWAASPYGRYLDHGRWTEIGFAQALCQAIPGGSFLLPAALYIGGWVLMTAAMMLPSTVPLLEIFRRVTERHPDQGLLMALVVAGYLAVWGLFGVAAHGVDAVVHAAVRQSVWLALNGWVLGAAVLTTAGLFQFSALKYQCLDQCRSPFSFVQAHWRGRSERRQAWVLGVHHGLFCVGCCWALMLLMFVVGSGSVGWMLLLGALMAAEKNLPWGRKLSTPLGIALLAWGLLVALSNA